MVNKTDFNAKVTELQRKIPSITGLATNSALTAVKNKIPDDSSLVKKTDYNTKISEIENKVNDHNHDKYVTTPEFDTMAADVFKATLAAQTDLIRKPGFDSKLKGIILEVKVILKRMVQKVFQPMYRYFKRIAGVSSGNYIYFWKSKGLSDEELVSITASNYKITPELSFYDTKTRLEFNGSCLKQDKVTYNHGKIINIYIVYEISQNYSISSYPTLENCLFGAVSLTKNADIDKYKYSGYGIGFDRHGESSFGNGLGKNCIIFGADLSSSLHANNQKNNILVLGKDFVQGINGTTIYAEKSYKINFTEKNKKFCLSLHYNGANRYIFINGTEIHKFKAKDAEIVTSQLCLGTFQKTFL